MIIIICLDHYFSRKSNFYLKTKKLIKKSGNQYTVTDKGWKWVNDFDISKEEVLINRRPLARHRPDLCTGKPALRRHREGDAIEQGGRRPRAVHGDQRPERDGRPHAGQEA